MREKRGQHILGMPFGVIFSIFLIIVFIVIAFIAIGHFLDIGKCGKIGQFYDKLQAGVREAHFSQESNVLFEPDLPSGIEQICFGNLSKEITNQEAYNQIEIYKQGDNIFLLPQNEACEMSNNQIRYLNISKMIEQENPYCLPVESFNIKKGFYSGVVIEEQ
ncbi:MAG: hypothetical protein ACP5D2_03620 [Candidatus Nanoarchaeia archaeon]